MNIEIQPNGPDGGIRTADGWLAKHFNDGTIFIENDDGVPKAYPAVQVIFTVGKKSVHINMSAVSAEHLAEVLTRAAKRWRTKHPEVKRVTGWNEMNGPFEYETRI